MGTMFAWVALVVVADGLLAVWFGRAIGNKDRRRARDGQPVSS